MVLWVGNGHTIDCTTVEYNGELVDEKRVEEIPKVLFTGLQLFSFTHFIVFHRQSRCDVYWVYVVLGDVHVIHYSYLVRYAFPFMVEEAVLFDRHEYTWAVAMLKKMLDNIQCGESLVKRLEHQSLEIAAHAHGGWKV